MGPMGNRPWVPDLYGDETDVLLEKKPVYSGIVLPKIPKFFVGFCGEITMPHPTKILTQSSIPRLT